MIHSFVLGEFCSACMIYQGTYSLKSMLVSLPPVACLNCQALAELLKTLTTAGKHCDTVISTIVTSTFVCYHHCGDVQSNIHYCFLALAVAVQYIRAANAITYT
jgi:hypothetical protein